MPENVLCGLRNDTCPFVWTDYGATLLKAGGDVSINLFQQEEKNLREPAQGGLLSRLVG